MPLQEHMRLSFPRFAGTRFLAAKDKNLALLCVRAWNDWMLDEWCAAAPDRFVPFGILPLWDPRLAAGEARRLIDKGCRAIGFPENPSPLGLPSFHTDHWDPVFAVTSEAGVPLCMHFGTSGVKPTVAPDAPTPVVISLMGSNSAAALADLLFSPVFHNFPSLRVSLAEDYPHSDSAWPHSRKRAAEVLADVPDDEAHRIVELNACEMLGWRPWADAG
jgi:predicted TIM-barrel fold metal-dependent hydrolase